MIDPLSPENPKLSEENLKREMEIITPAQLSERCAYKGSNNSTTIEGLDKEFDDIVSHYHKIIVNPESLGLEIVYAANALLVTHEVTSKMIRARNIFSAMIGDQQIATIAHRFEIRHEEWCRANGAESHWSQEQMRVE